MKNLLILLSMLCSTLIFAQAEDCQDFKEGKFKIQDKLAGNSTIERYGNKQVEMSEKSGMKLEFEVEWKDECTYTLKLVKILENPNEIALPTGMILRCRIIKTSENSYVVESTSDDFKGSVKAELIKI